MANALTEARVNGPIAGGLRGWPFAASTLDLTSLGYAEEEFFLEGEAVRYRPAEGTALGPDGYWGAEAAQSAPFKTRFLVYRPVDAERFNGSVVVIWNNVSAGYDLFNADSLELFESGFAVVAVTTQPVAITGLPPVPNGMATWDPERYGSLHIKSDDYSFDIFTQAARAVGRDRSRTGVDPMNGLNVQRLIAQGSSQSAQRLASYINAVQPLSRAFDAFILNIYFGFGYSLEVGDQVVNINDPNRPRSRPTNLLRQDLGVPVMVVNSELEAISCYPVRQPDSPLFRSWEVAAACHTSLQGNMARQAKYSRDFGGERPLIEGMNRVPMGPVFDAALHHVHRWLAEGLPPPSQPRIEFAGEPPEIVRDALGIAVGGVRLPQADVPVAVNSSIPLADDISSRLAGSCRPLTLAQLRALYRNEADFVAKFRRAGRSAMEAGVLLARDFEPLVRDAIEEFRTATADRPNRNRGEPGDRH